MLLGFGAKNFCSFKEGFEVSLENKNALLTVLGIKGGNASGKTNVLRTLSFLKSFMMDSFSLLEPDEGILIKSFFDSEEVIEMYIHFKIESLEYKYEVKLTKESIIREELYRKDKRWTLLLVREAKQITECITELDVLMTINLNRSNASVISIAHQYGLKELDTFYRFAENIVVNVSYFGKRSNDDHFLSYTEISDVYYHDKKLLKLVGDILNKADTGINRIEIIKYKDQKNDRLIYEPIFIHNTDQGEESLYYEDESDGVKVLYRQLDLYFNALKQGMVVAFDEFDISIHPDLLPIIIDLFESKEINTSGAQLIFTSHHTEIIDKLGKYRTVFVNKEENESFLYRLDEIPGDMLRPDRSLLPAYNSHKIGGRPKVINA